MAGAFLKSEKSGHTLQPTALVHEAYVRVLQQTGVHWKNPGHLRAVSAQAMRRVLVDHARKRLSSKRGGDRNRVTFVTEVTPGEAEAPTLDVLVLEEALEQLTERNERQARIVELRFFGGLTQREIADVLGVSETTVEDHWRIARAWLNRELSRGLGGSEG